MTEQGSDLEYGSTFVFAGPSSSLTMLTKELAALAPVLDMASAAQWSVPPRRRPDEDTAERSKGPHSDPTPGIAIDERRLALSVQIKESDRIVREAAAAVRGVRRGLELRFAEWEAEG